MAVLVVWLVSVSAGVALGIALGVRRERGRYALYREIVAERKRQGGIKLRRIQVRR